MLFQKERSILYLNGSQRCCVWQQGIQATVLAGKRAFGFCWGKRESRNFRSASRGHHDSRTFCWCPHPARAMTHGFLCFGEGISM